MMGDIARLEEELAAALEEVTRHQVEAAAATATAQILQTVDTERAAEVQRLRQSLDERMEVVNQE